MTNTPAKDRTRLELIWLYPGLEIGSGARRGGSQPYPHLVNEALTQPIYARPSRIGQKYGSRMFRRLVVNLSGISNFSWRADCPTGAAWVIDGDTIIVAGERVRLHGIDAPELDQTFWWRGQELMCGMMALAALEALTAGVKIRCEGVERDLYGRLVAKCFSPNGIDIGRRLVSAGWALAYRRYSTDYVNAEEEARMAKRGMWRGSFVEPWVWRASSVQRGT